MANLKPNMFRAYDLRGLVGEELNEFSVEIIAKAFGTMLIKRGINTAVLGHDSRKSSEEFRNIFAKALASTGVNVIDLGMVITPMMYSAQYHFKTKGGAMITASHNPNEYNGLKLGLDYSYTTQSEEMRELHELTKTENFARGEGKITKEEFFETYVKDLLGRIKLGRKLKVVVNTGNGTAGAFVPKILREAGCEVVEHLTNLDPTFPKYYPNPTLVEMMEDTDTKVRESGADIGLAFDGDGDRLGITDENGKTIWPDRWLILLARQTLKKVPGGKIVFDVPCSQALIEDIEAHGGVPVMWKTGHSFIKAKRAEEKAPLAGEKSGHVFFGPPEYYGFDDGCFTALKLLEYISNQQKSFSEIISQTPFYVISPTIHAPCPDEVKYQVLAKIVEEFKKDFKDSKVIDIDGARVIFDDGWGIVRASSNLPVLVLRFEAKTEERMKEIENLFRERLAKYPEISQEWRNG
jgi:phosphomannomutase/phosphoglucomutase